MLQHNTVSSARPAHLAHAAVLSLHTLCCGLPALAMLAAAVSGAASGLTFVSELFGEFHAFMHAHEIWILILSAALVVVGGGLEGLSRRVRKSQGLPWLFVFSVLCLVANLALIVIHRAA
jgi:hypothetical protein